MAEILARPYHPYTQGLLDAAPRFDRPARQAGADPRPAAASWRPARGLSLPRPLRARRRSLRGVAGAGRGRCRPSCPVLASAPRAGARLRGRGMIAPLLEASDLRVTFGSAAGRVHALDGVSLAVSPGETVSLVGESGSGKSTLAMALMRALRRDSGSIRFEGAEIGTLSAAALKPIRRRLQMIFQNPYASLDPPADRGGDPGRALDCPRHRRPGGAARPHRRAFGAGRPCRRIRRAATPRNSPAGSGSASPSPGHSRSTPR